VRGGGRGEGEEVGGGEGRGGRLGTDIVCWLRCCDGGWLSGVDDGWCDGIVLLGWLGDVVGGMWR
jgi:hypothetical protein